MNSPKSKPNTVTIESKVHQPGGATLSVLQKAGGEITVTRHRPDGEETVEVYSDKDALADDKAAFEIFTDSDGQAVFVKLKNLCKELNSDPAAGPTFRFRALECVVGLILGFIACFFFMQFWLSR